MKSLLWVVLITGAALLLAGPVFADEPLTAKVSSLKREAPDAASGSGGKAGAGNDAQLDSRKSDFFRFAQTKLREMNRNHRLSRERMQIEKQPDGSFRAVYHQIDDASMACEVNRSQSKSIPFVAVLSYKEQIYAASCTTPAECRRGAFSPVGMIPNRHIFSYKNGAWN